MHLRAAARGGIRHDPRTLPVPAGSPSRAFRARFEGEMLLNFEDALASEGGVRLLFDAVRSLARQWLIRQTSGFIR